MSNHSDSGNEQDEREHRCKAHNLPFYACLDLCEEWGLVLLIVFILGGVGWLVEFVSHRARNSPNPFYSRLYERVAHELAVLGIFSFVLFSVTLSDFPEEYRHLVEFVHILIFTTGSFYLLSVLVLLLTVNWLVLDWAAGAEELELRLQAVYERAREDPVKREEEWDEARGLTEVLQEELQRMADEAGDLTWRHLMWVRMLRLLTCGLYTPAAHRRLWHVRQMQSLYALRRVYQKEAFEAEGAPGGRAAFLIWGWRKPPEHLPRMSMASS